MHVDGEMAAGWSREETRALDGVGSKKKYKTDINMLHVYYLTQMGGSHGYLRAEL